MKKPLIIGSVHTDLVSYVKELPKGNEEMQVLRNSQRVSGTGYTLARIFSGFGFPYELIAPYGSGVYGDFAREDAKIHGIDLKYANEAVGGCTYHLIDENGEETGMTVPGGEYEFDREYVQDLTLEELNCVVLAGEMLTGDSAIDLLETVRETELPVVYLPGERGNEIEEELRDALLSMKPEIFAADTDAYYLSGEASKELRDTAEKLHEITGNAVMIARQKEGIFCIDGEESYLAPMNEKFDSLLASGFYLASRQAGIDHRNALLFSLESCSLSRNRIPDEKLMRDLKKNLASLILHK